jgi:hypothetical protein
LALLITKIKSRTVKEVQGVVALFRREDAYRITGGNPEGQRALGRPRGRCVDDIKIILDRKGLYGLDSFGSGQGPV